MKFILASASPRRNELLKLITEDFICHPADIDETVPETIESHSAPEYLALLKAEHIAKKYPDKIIIGADTTVFLGDTPLGKPKNEDDAFNMLKALSGKPHTVITGCALVFDKKKISFSVSTKVYFKSISDIEIKKYILTGEPMDKAGAYGIQGKGALLCEKIEGDYFNIVGLPVSKLNDAIKDFCNE